MIDICQTCGCVVCERCGHCHYEKDFTKSMCEGQCTVSTTCDPNDPCEDCPREETVKDVELVDEVISFMENHRQQAVERLFPDATEEYKTEWLERPTVRFWQHLDDTNRLRVVNFAREHYR